jgi:small subunit ribosomal protein S17
MTDTNVRNNRKVREGLVVSNKMNKTVVIAIIERVRHPKYDKFVTRTKKLYAHDEANDAKVGDKVRVVETRPLSKLKFWSVQNDSARKPPQGGRQQWRSRSACHQGVGWHAPPLCLDW